MNCEKCGKGTTAYQLFDYCSACSKNLCADCMKAGCCGNVPAISGEGSDGPQDCETCGGNGSLADADSGLSRKCLDCNGAGKSIAHNA